ncbi:glycosyltransferase [Avibacterium paragallinarum]|uniref:glycosyltransferase n=1 Tax=Avibacterium paragallinarum TaxID=728 RepID=UPI00397C9CE0
MKILFLHRWLVMGGVEKVLINYLHLLKDVEEFEIDVLLDTELEDSHFSKMIPDNIRVSYIFSNDDRKLFNDLYSKKYDNILNRIIYKFVKLKTKKGRRNELNRHIIDGQYDVVINFSDHFDSYINFRTHNLPIIRWVHGSFRPNQDKYAKKAGEYFYKYKRIVAICEEMSEQIRVYLKEKKQYSFDTDKVSMIFNPINFDEIIMKSKEIVCVKKPYFVQVARLDKGKRHCDLINIYSELVRVNNIKENLYIIGGGEEYENLNTQIAKLNLQSRCFLLGEVNNPYPYMKDATLFLHTSESEGLPTVLLESLALNVPVIAMNCKTGVKEILNYGKCGELIPLGDLKQFVDKTFELLNAQDKLNIYKENIKSHLQIFSEDCIKYNFKMLVKSVIEDKTKK